ncbi:hypothetical protein MFIFM68171_09651 [Madurella fahalii]|uniref:Uncharacterized protein n=1 Tax=Madurella fahalii TaxID=1157608 RepID=A0ABQ0GNX4_9PEZI
MRYLLKPIADWGCAVRQSVQDPPAAQAAGWSITRPRQGWDGEGGVYGLPAWNSKCPVGGWSGVPKFKVAGLFAKMALKSDIEGYVPFFTSVVSGYSQEQVLVYIAHLRRELRNTDIYGYFRLRVV